MKIITRQKRGGFVARFDTDTKFAKLGKTREAAIGNLVLARKKALGITGLRWDMDDAWTRNYVQGNSNKNRAEPALFSLNPEKLPEVASLEEARTLSIDNIDMPILYRKTLLYLGFKINEYSNKPVTLGDFGMISEQRAIELSCIKPGPHQLGKKQLAFLKALLAHYGLSFLPPAALV